MKLDYPCTFDMGRADVRDRLGFDIFINDNSATIGSIPILGAGTGEVFLMVSEVGNENVMAIVSPFVMRMKTMRIEIPGIPGSRNFTK